MKNIITLIMLFSCISFASEETKKKNFVDFVNPLVGTDSEYKLSNGNTYPAIALPWGMNFWTPQTGKMGDGWQYTYDAFKIRGFKQTHQPSPWINDYGAFSIMPVVGKLKFKEDDRAAWFSHKREIAKPYYYQVYLGDYDTWVELTPTERSAQFRISYPQTDKAYLVIDAFHQGSYIKVLPKERKIIGFNRNNNGGVPNNFHNYFVVYLDKEIDSVYTWNGSDLYPDRNEEKGAHVGTIIKLKVKKDDPLVMKISSSFISIEQAEQNLAAEIGSDSFEETMNKAKSIWNDGLGRIEIEGGSEEQIKTFYTALYRTMLFPRKFYEIDRNNNLIHYSPYNGKVLPGYMFTDNGFWDTFRAVFPFFTIMYRELSSQIMEGLANVYKESGWLPEWASPGHRDCMIGSNSASIIADAYLKGIRGFDINICFDGIINNSNNEGPLKSVGRYGAKYYNTLGYIPYDVKINENVARTLEYSYADFTIMKLAKELNRPKSEIDIFAKRAFNYKNVFDPATNFMRGKNKDGSWQSPFVPEKWGDAFTEGSAWHYTWSVFHDPQGLIDLMGGEKKFVSKLDSVFNSPPTFDYSYYGHQIHEITEMVIAGMGQYAHGNQPIQHAIYLYNYAGEPWKAQKYVRQTLELMYSPFPDGLCGDEDNGQTSAWYVFSASGFYPVCPGTNQYVIGSPLFDKVTFHLENKKSFTIVGKNNSKDNYYINNAILNGKDYTKNYITHRDIMDGGKIIFEMSKTPNFQRGIISTDYPYSYSNELKK